MAPPSVGVATPMKIVPSTRKISASGGTMTKMTCSASTDNSPIRSSLLRTAKEKASVMATDMVRTTKSAPAFTVVVRSVEIGRDGQRPASRRTRRGPRAFRRVPCA